MSRDLHESHDHVVMNPNNNDRFLASKCGRLCKTLYFLAIHHLTSIILAAHVQNISLVGMAVFNDVDNTLVLIFRSLKVPMEISIGDLTF